MSRPRTQAAWQEVPTRPTTRLTPPLHWSPCPLDQAGHESGCCVGAAAPACTTNRARQEPPQPQAINKSRRAKKNAVPPLPLVHLPRLTVCKYFESASSLDLEARETHIEARETATATCAPYQCTTRLLFADFSMPLSLRPCGLALVSDFVSDLVTCARAPWTGETKLTEIRACGVRQREYEGERERERDRDEMDGAGFRVLEPLAHLVLPPPHRLLPRHPTSSHSFVHIPQAFTLLSTRILPAYTPAHAHTRTHARTRTHT